MRAAPCWTAPPRCVHVPRPHRMVLAPHLQGSLNQGTALETPPPAPQPPTGARSRQRALRKRRASPHLPTAACPTPSSRATHQQLLRTGGAATCSAHRWATSASKWVLLLVWRVQHTRQRCWPAQPTRHWVQTPAQQHVKRGYFCQPPAQRQQCAARTTCRALAQWHGLFPCHVPSVRSSRCQPSSAPSPCPLSSS